jgi:hypothetical protein
MHFEIAIAAPGKKDDGQTMGFPQLVQQAKVL